MAGATVASVSANPCLAVALYLEIEAAADAVSTLCSELAKVETVMGR